MNPVLHPPGAPAVPLPGDLNQHVFVDIDEQAAALTGWNQRYQQLSAGVFRGGVQRLQLPGVGLFVEDLHQAVHQTGQVRPQVVALGVPALLHGDSLFCGQPGDAASVYVFSGRDGFEFRSPKRHVMLGIEIDAPLFESQVLDDRAVSAPGAFAARAGLLALAIVGALATIGVTQFKGEPLQMAFLTLSAVFLLVHLASQAYRMSYLDALTELNGRRALTEELGLLGNRYVIAMLDIDHFKSINDRYGHDVGDQVLRNLAKRLRGVKGSRAFRFGGEEVCLTFSRTPLKLAVERMEGLRVAIEADVLSLKGKPGSKRAPPPLKLTVSVGVAESAAGVVAQDVLKAADQALYRAKQAGRNRVLAERS